MNEDRFERLLQQLKDETVPDPPENLADRVLGAIRTSEPEETPVEGWHGIPWATMLRFAAAIAVVATGSGLIVGSAIARPSGADDRLAARQALSFEVFDMGSFGVPSKFLE